jgi:uncharacterized protein (DUF1499 family)
MNPTKFLSFRLSQFLLCLILLLFFVQCTGTRPDDLGVRDSGSLKPCPPSPNCVTSQCDPSDTEHFISSVKFTGKLSEAKEKLKAVILNQPRAVIITEKDNYIHAEFTSKIMRYVDDVEFYLDSKTNTLHFRSASRLGRSDFGVNRARIEKIKIELGWN